MGVQERVLEQLVVPAGGPANLAGRDPGWTGGPDFEDLTKDELHDHANEVLKDGVEELSDAQELLWASDTYALLVVFQAMDAAGKDSAIEHVMSGVNPQGVQVVLVQDAARRRSSTTTSSGAIVEGAPRARADRHLQPLALRGGRRAPASTPSGSTSSSFPAAMRGRALWDERYEDINAFERHLDRSGTKVVKFFLHVSKDEQKRRFFARLDQPDKQWKFNAGRRRRARALGRVHGRLRGRDLRRPRRRGRPGTCPGRPQVAHAGARRARSS